MRAFLIGVVDGWEQPHAIDYSRNVDHLCKHDCAKKCGHNWQDRGINVGQFLRAGFRSESWRLRYWPFGGVR